MDLRGLSPALLAIVSATSGCALDDSRCQTAQADDFRCSMLVDDSSDTLETGTDSDACLDGDDNAILRIENRTGNAIEVVSFVRCDGSEPTEFPLMPPGLPDGDDVEIPLPGPGCWMLGYSGDGCEAETPHETAMDVCAGATYVWTPDHLNHVCMG